MNAVDIQLIDCERYHAQLTKKACVKRWRRANKATSQRSLGRASQYSEPEASCLLGCVGCLEGQGRALARRPPAVIDVSREVTPVAVEEELHCDAGSCASSALGVGAPATPSAPVDRRTG